MVGVLKSDNLIIIYLNHFLFFEWMLEEADFQCDSTLRSPEFITKGRKTSFLEIIVDSRGFLYLTLWNPKFAENARFVLTMIDKNNSVIYTNTKKLGSCFAENSDLVLLRSKISYIKICPIIVSCTVKASDLENESSDAMEKLSLDFQTFLDEAIDTDIVLKVGEDSIKAHKLVLQARSPVFRKMFDNDSREAAENEVVVSDIRSVTMKRLANFLYSAANETGNFEETLELYYAADKYGVLSLREVCKKELLSHLNTMNACSLFTFAKRHNDEDFMDRVVRFASANYKSVFNMDSLKDMSKDDMALLISLCVPDIN